MATVAEQIREYQKQIIKAVNKKQKEQDQQNTLWNKAYVKSHMSDLGFEGANQALFDKLVDKIEDKFFPSHKMKSGTPVKTTVNICEEEISFTESTESTESTETKKASANAQNIAEAAEGLFAPGITDGKDGSLIFEHCSYTDPKEGSLPAHDMCKTTTSQEQCIYTGETWDGNGWSERAEVSGSCESAEAKVGYADGQCSN